MYETVLACELLLPDSFAGNAELLPLFMPSAKNNMYIVTHACCNVNKVLRFSEKSEKILTERGAEGKFSRANRAKKKNRAAAERQQPFWGFFSKDQPLIAACADDNMRSVIKKHFQPNKNQ